jgi:hypothetical protein
MEQLLVGPAGAAVASSTGVLFLLYAFTIMNNTKPTIIRLIIVFIHAPYKIALFWCCYGPSAAKTASASTLLNSEKSFHPVKYPDGHHNVFTKPFTNNTSCTRKTIPATCEVYDVTVIIKSLNSLYFKTFG